MTGNTRSDPRGGKPARLSDRGFGFLFTVIFGAVGAVMWIAGGVFPAWAAGLAGLFAALALGAPGALPGHSGNSSRSPFLPCVIAT